MSAPLPKKWKGLAGDLARLNALGVKSETIVERAADALDKAAELAAALEWIAHFDDSAMEVARTLHIDMRGKAREALAAALTTTEEADVDLRFLNNTGVPHD